VTILIYIFKCICRNFQFDIDRIFSAKVKVFDYSTTCCSTEGALVTIGKSILKHIQEYIRTRVLSGHEALCFSVDLQFLKQVSSTLSKESAQQIDGVFDQVQQAIRVRAVDPDGIQESVDLATIARVVNGGVTSLSKSSIIFQQR